MSDFFIGSSQFYISLAKNHFASILAKYCLDFQSCVTGSTIQNSLVGAIYKQRGVQIEWSSINRYLSLFDLMPVIYFSALYIT